MPITDFNTFFPAAFEDKRLPSDYKQRLAAGPNKSSLISIPSALRATP
jgi:hypothetical protein